MTADQMNDSLQILEHRSVLKSQHSNLEPGQILSSGGVVLGGNRVEVFLPVEFDRQSALQTVEVDDVAPDTVLPAKLLSV